MEDGCRIPIRAVQRNFFCVCGRPVKVCPIAHPPSFRGRPRWFTPSFFDPTSLMEGYTITKQNPIEVSFFVSLITDLIKFLKILKTRNIKIALITRERKYALRHICDLWKLERRYLAHLANMPSPPMRPE